MAEVDNGKVRHLQLKRCLEVFPKYEDAKEYIETFDASTLSDGELYLVRYVNEDGGVSTIVYSVYYDAESDVKYLSEGINDDTLKKVSIEVGSGLTNDDGVVSVLLDDDNATQSVLGFNSETNALQVKDIDCGEF